ncbi:MAG: O-antigen ligase family protein [Fimbriimonadales bacterium]|nr:O-antigen ligase family protein [Fimbriimonadales bacterium]
MNLAPWILAGLALFLAPLLGGQVPVDAQPLDPTVSPWVAALVGSAEGPLLSHALFGCMGLAALAWCAAFHRVLQLPKLSLAGMAAGLALLLALSATVSPFRMAAVTALAGWLLTLSALWMAAAVAGRSLGPKVLLGALWAGTVAQACLALLEYGSMRAVDPSWRVFGTWVNPNALAAMLQIGWLLGLALLGTARRPWNLAAFAGQAVLGLALLLTQSKGVFLTVAFGTAIYLSLMLVRAEESQRRRRAASGALAAVAVLALLGFALRATQPQQGPSALGRVVRAEQTSEQSSGFRLLLWRGAAQLATRHPEGVGVGAYRYRSAEPGLTTQTYYAHNSFLQLAAEASWLSAGLLAALLLAWGVEALRALRRVPWERAAWRSSVFAAVVAAAAHSLIDSDLHYAGLGFAFFALLGLGLSLAPDGVSPELTPKPLRLATLAIPVGLAALMLWLGWQRALVCQAVGLATAGQRTEAARKLRQAETLAPFDGEVFYLLAQLEPPGPDRESLLQRAVRLAPSTRHLRALAREQAASGRTAAAVATLSQALRFDPNNLPTWALILELQQAGGDLDAAVQTARRMVRIEQTPYFRVRALPEIIPTETALARVFLAERARAPEERIRWLAPAVELYRRYRDVTLPRVVQAAKQGASLGGETADRAREVLADAERATLLMAAAYRTAGRTAEAVSAEEEASSFAAAAEGLPSR